MLLAINIGNTNINFGVFSVPRCHSDCITIAKSVSLRAPKGRSNLGSKIASSPYPSAEGEAPLLQKFTLPRKKYTLDKLKRLLGPVKINDAVICSVVPPLTKKTENGLKKIISGNVYIIDKNLNLPIKNLYRRPQQLGADRLINAYAASKLYGVPLVAIDFGSAITFDCVSKNRKYLGGMILPGLQMCLNALAEKTALLPKINLADPKEFIGRDTKTCMLSGIVFGYASLTDELVKKIKRKIGKSALVIGTGGNIRLIAKYCKELDKIDPDLTLKGLALAYDIVIA